MSLRLALELSDRIAAVAPVAAAMPAVPCSAPERPVSVLFMNGTEDPLLPWDGGEVAPSMGGRGTVLSARESVDVWVSFLRADPIPVTESLPDIDAGDGSTVRRIAHTGGVEGTEVVLYEVAGGATSSRASGSAIRASWSRSWVGRTTTSRWRWRSGGSSRPGPSSLVLEQERANLGQGRAPAACSSRRDALPGSRDSPRAQGACRPPRGPPTSARTSSTPPRGPEVLSDGGPRLTGV